MLVFLWPLCQLFQIFRWLQLEYSLGFAGQDHDVVGVECWLLLANHTILALDGPGAVHSWIWRKLFLCHCSSFSFCWFFSSHPLPHLLSLRYSSSILSSTNNGNHRQLSLSLTCHVIPFVGWGCVLFHSLQLCFCFCFSRSFVSLLFLVLFGVVLELALSEYSNWIGVPIFSVWMWGINVYIWSRVHINHVFIFELDPRHALTHLHIFQVTWLFFCWCFLAQLLYPLSCFISLVCFLMSLEFPFCWVG